MVVDDVRTNEHWAGRGHPAAQVPFSPAVNESDRHLPLGFTVVWRRLATLNNVE